MTPTTSVRPRKVMSAINGCTGMLMLFGIWKALPARWAPVDAGGSLMALSFLASALGLWRGAAWSTKVARAVASVSLVGGAVLLTALILTAGTLAGLYGPVGGGGSLILGATFVMLVPYLIVFPASQLYFLLPSADMPVRGDAESGDAAS